MGKLAEFCRPRATPFINGGQAVEAFIKRIGQVMGNIS